jgi:hypothetical protein
MPMRTARNRRGRYCPVAVVRGTLLCREDSAGHVGASGARPWAERRSASRAWLRLRCAVALNFLQCDDPLTPGLSPPRGQGESYATYLFTGPILLSVAAATEGPGVRGYDKIGLSTRKRDRVVTHGMVP